MLPTQKTKKKTDLRDFLILLYGLPKIGKTTACSRIEGALFIPTEPGFNSLEIYATDIVESWEHFLEICKEVSKGKHEYKTIIIDVLDHLYQHCANYFCKMKNKEHEGDIGFGKGISMIRNEIIRAIKKLASLETGLILISHCAKQEIEDRTGMVTGKTIPSFATKAWGKSSLEPFLCDVVGLADTVLFATLSKNENGDVTRIVRSLPSKEYEAGDRTGLFEDGLLLSDLFTKKKGGK
jgi:hypothetical protein